MKGLQLLLKTFGLDMEPETLAMIQALIPQLPAKINEASAAINAALQNFDARLRAIETQQKDLAEALQIMRHDIFDLSSLSTKQLQEDLREVLNGYTGRTSDASGPDAGASGGDSGGTAGTGRRRRGE